MNEEKNEMIKSLKEIFVPELRNLNFKGSFPHFRRTVDGVTNLLSFQFDKYGGGFVIEIANWEEPEFKTPWGKVIPLSKLTAQDLYQRQRIYPDSTKEDIGTNSWFRYDREPPTGNGNKFHEVAREAVDRLPSMEKYWGK